jgi:hypothetical protein
VGGGGVKEPSRNRAEAPPKFSSCYLKRLGHKEEFEFFTTMYGIGALFLISLFLMVDFPTLIFTKLL